MLLGPDCRTGQASSGVVSLETRINGTASSAVSWRIAPPVQYPAYPAQQNWLMTNPSAASVSIPGSSALNQQRLFDKPLMFKHASHQTSLY